VAASAAGIVPPPAAAARPKAAAASVARIDRLPLVRSPVGAVPGTVLE
jgi:hypothetical protein